MYTVVPKQSFISPGKSGGPGLFTRQPNCPASRAFSIPVTSGSPNSGRVRRECVLYHQRIAVRFTGGNHESANSVVVDSGRVAISDYCSQFRRTEKTALP